MNTQTNLQTTLPKSRNVMMVTYPDAHILDVVGPIEVLTGTKLFIDADLNPYNVTVVASQSGPIATTSGLSISADKSFAEAQSDNLEVDTLIIAGGHGTQVAIGDPDFLSFVTWAASKANRIVSICTGAMILAEIGLLNHRRATTHWFWCPIMKKQYPNVDVQPDALFIKEGHIWTSAGVTAGMDLSLALIEEDWGHDIALQVARYNVMYMMRPGGQTQFSAQLIAQQHADGPLSDTLEYIIHNPKENLTVTAMAARACMSERSFARKFKTETHMTPAQYVEIVRLEKARTELEQTNHAIEVVAHNTGFSNPETMRRAFQRHMGVSASDYRERFQACHARLDQVHIDNTKPPP